MARRRLTILHPAAAAVFTGTPDEPAAEVRAKLDEVAASADRPPQIFPA